MHAWIKKGIERFRAIFRYWPEVAATSNACQETELIWSINGIKAVALKNCRINSGQVVVYDNKPWKNQSPRVIIGDFNEFYNLVYLSRNVFFECTGSNKNSSAPVKTAFEASWRRGEPAVTSSHRAHYIGDKQEEDREELRKLLFHLRGKNGVRFLSSPEIASIYRKGWSIRR